MSDAHPPPARPRPFVATARLLLIEDDASIAQLFTDVLRDAGYAVVAALSMCEAAACFADHAGRPFDLVLSLPFWYGGTADRYAWLDQVRRSTRAPIVICTRSAARVYADYARRGYTAVLTEPCPLEDLLALVRSVLRSKQVKSVS